MSFTSQHPPRRSSFHVTERDVAIVRWIGRLRFAEAEQIAGRFEMDLHNAYRRLRGLIALDLVEHRRVFHAQPGAYTTTRAGLELAGLRLPPGRIDIRTYEHDRLMGDVAIALEREFGAAAMVTEREMRSVDATADPPRYAVRRGASESKRALHFPDLAVELDDGRRLAVEVELSAKGRTRLDSIVTAYVRAPRVSEVRYYVAPAALDGVNRAVDRAAGGDRFEVRLAYADISTPTTVSATRAAFS